MLRNKRIEEAAYMEDSENLPPLVTINFVEEADIESPRECQESIRVPYSAKRHENTFLVS